MRDTKEINDAQSRGQLLEALLTQYKVRIEKGEQEPCSMGNHTETHPISPPALASLIVGAAAISNIQQLGLAILRELIALRLLTTGELTKLEEEQSRIIKPFTA